MGTNQLLSIISQVAVESPLVHCITNRVVTNFQANVLLAVGASPAMAEEPVGAAELVAVADALSINIGTPTPAQEQAIFDVLPVAERRKMPVVLDPVAVGAIPYRLQLAHKILETEAVTLIRGNAGEVAALVGQMGQMRGVDAGRVETAPDVLAEQAARKFNCTVAVTGAVDAISDGRVTWTSKTGSPRMQTVTGTGCSLSAVMAAFCAVRPNDPVLAGAAAMSFYGYCGQVAAQNSYGNGSLQVELLDALSLYSQHAQDGDVRRALSQHLLLERSTDDDQ